MLWTTVIPAMSKSQVTTCTLPEPPILLEYCQAFLEHLRRMRNRTTRVAEGAYDARSKTSAEIQEHFGFWDLLKSQLRYMFECVWKIEQLPRALWHLQWVEWEIADTSVFTLNQLKNQYVRKKQLNRRLIFNYTNIALKKVRPKNLNYRELLRCFS